MPLIDAKLASLGYAEPKPAPTPAKPKKTAPKATGDATDPSANYDAEKECKVCRILGHHTRAHNRHPEPFTKEELAEKGWQVPA